MTLDEGFQNSFGQETFPKLTDTSEPDSQITLKIPSSIFFRIDI